MTATSETVKLYFLSLQDSLSTCYSKAQEARKLGLDPDDYVDIPLAKNMAERVEGLISAVFPHIKGSGISERIIELENQYEPLDWRVGFSIAAEVAQQKLCSFESSLQAMEVGIRVGFAYLTLGIVSAPLEGFIELRLKKRSDGKEYFSVFYAGPIRGAGGTAASTSVILADYVRVQMGFAPYDPTEMEVNRVVTEVQDYHERITNLQYYPSEEELRFMISHLPVEVNGDPTERIEVSNYKDLPRVETNQIRGGICLVIAEGLCQKAPKLWKRLSAWGEEMGLKDWKFLEDFLTLQKKIKSKGKGKSDSGDKGKVQLTPNYTFIADLVSGRPVLTHPMEKGGFRLRYGRTRLTGLSAAAVHPATMYVLNKFVAIGTQLKIERPGKAAAITSCDSILGPLVLLESGEVRSISSVADAKKYTREIKEILFVGDILVNYGDFSENGHVLVPPGYVPEWYVLELEKAIINSFGTLDFEKAEDLSSVSSERISNIISDPFTYVPTFKESELLSQHFSVPLHPQYTFFWKFLAPQDFISLCTFAMKGSFQREDQTISSFIFEKDDKVQTLLTKLSIPHTLSLDGNCILTEDIAHAFCFHLDIIKGVEQFSSRIEELKQLSGYNEDDCFSLVEHLCPVPLRDLCGTFIGTRMGRPEKAKMRKLTGSPHVLFPVGEEGGRFRSFQSALEAGKINSTFPLFRCPETELRTIYPLSERSQKPSLPLYFHRESGTIQDTVAGKLFEESFPFQMQEIDIQHYFQSALSYLELTTYPDLIKGVKGTSNKSHVPEHLAKGILRAKHDIFVNKDGTTRFDMSELPITAFKPNEVGTSLEKLKELGYMKDIHGKELTHDDQVIEIFPQDIILPGGIDALDPQAQIVLVNVAKFVDDLLVRFYKQEPYYNVKTPEDLCGHLVIGLAPHISAGMIGRIIGFSKTQGMLCHPMYHAALRRDCDGDEACVIMLMDALLNFSRSFLPDRRGSRTMDSPLVLTSVLVPSEVDDQVLGVDRDKRYPLALYEAALELKNPWDVNVTQLKHVLDTPEQFEGFFSTHPVTDFNEGICVSSYKVLPSMGEKLDSQMDLAEKIRAVDQSDVSRIIIEKHFLKDIRGNLRKFTMQKFRCVGCNEKFHRPPLIGKCTSCGGKIIFTISEGSVVKYLQPALDLAHNYNVSPYLKQTLEITKRRIESVFGKEKEKQMGLGDWVS